MKTINLIISLLLSFLILTSFEIEKDVEYYCIVGQGAGSLKWNGKTGVDMNCSPGGSNCSITVIITETEFTPVNDPGDIWRCVMKPGEIVVSINDNNTNITQNLSTANYTFPESSKLIVVKYKNISKLEGRTFDISNMITNNDGVLEFTFQL